MPKKKRAVTEAKAAPKSVAERTIEILRKAYPKNETVATTMAHIRFPVREVLPTGLAVLDQHVLGIGGLAYGRVVEVFGPESVGKSSLEWHLMAQAQRDGAMVVFGESEPSVREDWVDKFGVSRPDVVLPECDTIEDFLGETEVILDKATGTRRSRQKVVVFLDSVASLMPEKAVKAHLADKEIPGVMAAAWSRWLLVLSRKFADRDAILVLLNQVRSKIGVMYGATEDSPGGRAIKFYSSVRLQMNHGRFAKDGAARTGKWAGVCAIKNKLSVPMQRADVLLDFERGFDDARSTLYFAKVNKVVDPKCRSVREARECLGWPVGEGPAADAEIDDVEVKEGT